MSNICRAMDLGMLSVKFHFGGQFDDDGYSLNYNGGRVEMSEIDRDKVSLPELRGFLADHISLGNEDSVVFYWLFPGGTITNGLRKLVDDKDCMHMCECINDGGVVDVYAEIYKQQGGDDVVLSASLPSSVMKAAQDGDEQDGENNESHDEDSEEADSDDSDEGEAVVEEDDNDSEDSDYIQGDEDTTEDDEEATQFRANARNQRRNPFATAAAPCKVSVAKVPLVMFMLSLNYFLGCFVVAGIEWVTTATKQ